MEFKAKYRNSFKLYKQVIQLKFLLEIHYKILQNFQTCLKFIHF